MKDDQITGQLFRIQHKIKGVTYKFMIDKKLCQKQIYFILGYYVNLRP